MMSVHFLLHIGKMVDNLLKYLYLKFGIFITHIIQNISKTVKFSIMMRNDDNCRVMTHQIWSMVVLPGRTY